MKQLFAKLVFGIMLSVPALLLAQEAINEKQVRAFINKSDEIARSLDVDRIADMYSDDAKITIVTEFSGQTQTNTMNKEQYLQNAREVFPAITKYKYKRKTKNIEILNEKQARVTSSIKEVSVIAGNKIVMHGDEVVTLTLINGEIKITEIEAYGKLKL